MKNLAQFQSEHERGISSYEAQNRSQNRIITGYDCHSDGDFVVKSFNEKRETPYGNKGGIILLSLEILSAFTQPAFLSYYAPYLFCFGSDLVNC